MAQELQTQSKTTFKKDGKEAEMDSGKVRVTVVGGDYIKSTITLTSAAWVAVPKGTITSLGQIQMKNTDSAQVVQLSGTNGTTGLMIELPGGRSCSCPLLSTATLYIRAPNWAAGTVEVEYLTTEL